MSNSNFSHWDVHSIFTGPQAASLIVGIEPNGPDGARAWPLLNRMQEAYESAVDFARGRIEESFYDPFRLECLLTRALVDGADAYVEEGSRAEDHFYAWLTSPEVRFEKQRFERSEISRWLTAVGVASNYAFIAQESKDGAHEEPLGRRERENLLLVIGALLDELIGAAPKPSTQAKVIEALEGRFLGRGFSKRSLEGCFAEAKKLRLQSGVP